MVFWTRNNESNQTHLSGQTLSSTLRIFARVLDAGPEDCRFRNNARGLFDAGCHASEGAERNPSFLR